MYGSPILGQHPRKTHQIHFGPRLNLLKALIPSVKNRIAIRIADGEFLDYLGAEPAPPDILQQLIAGHMLISVSRDEVAFTHQLIQEHYAATKIVSVLVEKNEDAELAVTALTDYQWEQPLSLALEDLADQNRTAEIRIFLDRFRFVDFEIACRLAGTVKDFWPDLGDLFEPTIRHLASSENVNARWLAARCAAATGQPSFRDLVWTALKGHPQGSSDCFEGISSTFILRALGEDSRPRC